MSISLNTNFHLGSAEFLDSRQSVDTLDDLLNLDTNIIPNGFQIYVNELDTYYKYHKDYNEEDTGNWKLYDIPEFEILDEEDVFEALGMSEEELQNLATIISDDEIRTDKTYSSSKIYEEIEKIKNECGDCSVELTQEEYDNLSREEQMNGTVYYIKDANDLEDSPLSGKTIVFFGDSVSVGLGWQNEVGDYSKKFGWAYIIQENNPNAIIKNLAISGACIADTGNWIDVISQYTGMVTPGNENYVEKPDYLIFSGSGNDAFQNVEKGTMCENYSPTYDKINTTIGALEYMFMHSCDNYPTARKGFIITQKLTNEVEEYYEIVRKVCEKWSIPILDLSKVGEVNAHINGVKNVYYLGDDSVHPNQKCYREILAPKVEKWIKNEMI